VLLHSPIANIMSPIAEHGVVLFLMWREHVLISISRLLLPK